jgi:hypothetical protein
LTEEQWVEQAKQNAEEMTFFMHQLGDALGTQIHDEDGSTELNSQDE